MSEENKTIKSLVILTVVSLLLSVAALTLSIFNYTHSAQGQKKVIISKQYDKGKSLDKAIDTKKPMIIFFYTDWCGYCQRFAPIFHKITKDSALKKHFAIAYVNCEKEENQQYIQEYQIQGFPTVFVVDKENKKTQLDIADFYENDAKKIVKEKMLNLIGENQKDENKKDEENKD